MAQNNKKYFHKMKYIRHILLVFLSVILLCSCENKNHENSFDPVPVSVTIKVLKFKNPEYKNYVLANISSNGNGYTILRSSSCDEPIGKSGFSPYWELSNDWLLVDWKWPGFPNNDDPVLLVDEPWGNIQSANQTWSSETPHIADPIDSMLNISVNELDAYFYMKGGIRYGEAFYYYIYRSSIECISNQYEEMDNVWSILQRDLSIVIENGDLEQLYVQK